MKLSQVTTERAADLLCELTPYIISITADEELVEELKNAVKAQTKAELITRGVKKISKICPIVFKKHKEDVFAILGVLNDKTAEEIAAQNFLVTMMQMRDIIKDKELMDFFKSCGGTEESA